MQSIIKKYQKDIVHLVLVVMFVTPEAVLASATPSETIDASMQELFTIDVEQHESQSQLLNKPWRFGYQYTRVDFEGYQSKDRSLSNSDVLFEPGTGEARTAKNFPVLPTEISQSAHVLTGMYTIDSSQYLSFGVPFIKQSTDHISSVSGYENFNITSEGLGDIYGNYFIWFSQHLDSRIGFGLGLSLPTGSIDQKGDTPRASGDQQLPYTMQLGSGTIDLPLTFRYLNSQASYDWGTDVYAKLRLGKNDRNYRLGNRMAVDGWLKWNIFSLRPQFKIKYQYWSAISGTDTELMVPGTFPFPASITNPAFYGGEKVVVQIRATQELMFGRQKHQVSVELGAPVYQSLNGVQTKQRLQASLQWQLIGF